MTSYWVICVETSDYFFSSLKGLSEPFLLLKHFFLVSSLLFINNVLSFLYHIIEISWFFVNSPSVFYLMWLELKHIFLKQHVDFCIFVDFYSHLLNLNSNWSIQIVFELTRLLNVYSLSFDLLFYFFETFEMFNSRGDDSFWDGFDKSMCNFSVFARHVVTYLFSFDVKQADLYPFNYFITDFSFSFAVSLNLILNFFDIFCFIFLNSLQFFGNIE